MVLDFSLELKDVEGKCKDVENRFQEKQKGEARIMFFYFLHLITLALCSLRTLHSIIPLIRRLDKLVLVLRHFFFY